MDCSLDESWKNLMSVAIFGYGRTASKLIETLEKEFDIVAIFDNDLAKQGLVIKEKYKIENPAKLNKKKCNYKIIISAMGKTYCQIADQLKSYGLKENIDFIQSEKFLTLWYWQFKHQVRMLKTDLMVTSYCNLKCKKCASFIPYWKKYEHTNVRKLKESIDYYFRYVDFVYAMDLYGGEPLLYTDLEKLIVYLKDNYNSKIGNLGIITNGLVPIRNELIETMKRYDISISVSDYSQTLGNTKEKIDTFCDNLENNGIRYIRNTNLVWKDLGFPKEKFVIAKEKQQEHRLLCNNMCHNLYDNKLYFCAAMLAAEKAGLYKNSEKDIFDLEKECMSDNDKEFLIGWANGIIHGNYNGFCNVCAGYGSDNNNEIIAAEQI